MPSASTSRVAVKERIKADKGKSRYNSFENLVVMILVSYEGFVLRANRAIVRKQNRIADMPKPMWNCRLLASITGLPAIENPQMTVEAESAAAKKRKTFFSNFMAVSPL
jgi:hypothetical protein